MELSSQLQRNNRSKLALDALLMCLVLLNVCPPWYLSLHHLNFSLHPSYTHTFLSTRFDQWFLPNVCRELFTGFF